MRATSTKPLTKTQLAYLQAMEDQEWLTKGWGGYGSTLTIRILEERGLATVRDHGKTSEAHIRPAGREALRAAGLVRETEHKHYPTDERITPLSHGHPAGDVNHGHADLGYTCAAWA